MPIPIKYLVAAGLALLAALVAFLALWDIPAPTQTIEKEIPGDRLGR